MGCWLCLSQGKGQNTGRKKKCGSVWLRPWEPRWHQQNFPWKSVAFSDNASPLGHTRGDTPCPHVLWLLFGHPWDHKPPVTLMG